MSGDERGAVRDADHDAGPAAEYDLVVGSLDEGDVHVDDDVFPQYVTAARERFLHDQLGAALEGYGWPVVHLEVDFHAELFAGDRLTATVGVEDVGNTSFTATIDLFRDGEPVATATTVHVTQDLESGESVPVPETWRAVLQR